MNAKELLAKAHRLQREFEHLVAEIDAVFDGAKGVALSKEEMAGFYGAAGEIGASAADLYSAMEEYSQDDEDDESDTDIDEDDL